MIRANPDDVIGIVPAAGRATRLGALSESKEILRVWRPRGHPSDRPPLPACACLLGAFERARIDRALIVIRPGKEDIPRTLGPRTDAGTRLEYLVVDDPPAPPFTIDAARTEVSDRTVALGFPDILFEPREAFVTLLDRLRATSSDVVVGLFPHPSTRSADLVTQGADGLVLAVRRSARGVGPGSLTWGLAVWRSRFTDFLHDRVRELDGADPRVPRLGIGEIVDLAIRSGLVVRGERVATEPFLDIGTPDGLEEARRRADRFME